MARFSYIPALEGMKAKGITFETFKDGTTTKEQISEVEKEFNLPDELLYYHLLSLKETLETGEVIHDAHFKLMEILKENNMLDED